MNQKQHYNIENTYAYPQTGNPFSVKGRVRQL